MAWRIDQQVIRGEIDNRMKGRVTGRIWLLGREEPLELDLAGNAYPDLQGNTLRFTNPHPKAEGPTGLMTEQCGVTGDITASRKVKVPDCTDEELMAFFAARKPFPWHWGNSLYLEWFSRRNGRVVIESAAYQLEVGQAEGWTLTPAEEQEQQAANTQALTDFMSQLAGSLPAAHGMTEEDWQHCADDDDEAGSPAEAAADAEAARMDLLLDRVGTRLEREGHEDGNFERILDEERERLRLERGEPLPLPPTPDEEAAHEAWLEELNALQEETLAEMATNGWKDEPDARHPLVERCSDLSSQLFHQVKAGGWRPEHAGREHPITEIIDGVMIASSKLAGALGRSRDDDPWPPSALFAGSVLVRLKKARSHLRDALLALDSADQENLAVPAWRTAVRAEVEAILAEVQQLIAEVREVLSNADDELDS